MSNNQKFNSALFVSDTQAAMEQTRTNKTRLSTLLGMERNKVTRALEGNMSAETLFIIAGYFDLDLNKYKQHND